MMKVNVTPAKNWEVNSGFLGFKSTFFCGDCSKYNMKCKVLRLAWANHSDLVVSQCNFCGEFNTFHKGSTVLQFDDA